MGRYLKYLEIVNKIDSALEKMVSGKVDVNKDLPKLKTMLEVQEKALCMSQKIDHIDDAVKSTAKLYAMGDPSAQEVVEAVSHLLKKQKDGGGQQQNPQQMQEQAYGGGSPQGRDFRDRREDSRFEAGGGNTTRYRAEARSADAYDMDEEDRRGVKGTGRYSRYRRSRSEMEGDTYDMDGEYSMYEEDRRGVPGSGRGRSRSEYEEDRHRSRRTGRFVRGEMEQDNWYPLPFLPLGRMGYTGDTGEMNGPYNGIQVPVQNTAGTNTNAPRSIQGTPANRQTSNNAGQTAQQGA